MQAISWIARITGWGLLTAFQVLVLTQLDIRWFIQPYVFGMFIMILPFKTPQSLVLILAFIAGLVIDMFNNTPGMHAAATVAMAFFRPAVIKMLTPITGYEGVDAPSLFKLGFIWFLLFTLIMLGIHHIIYFFLEVLTFKNISYTLLKVGASLLVSAFLVLNFAFIFSNRAKGDRT
jgi:hypothetical protein